MIIPTWYAGNVESQYGNQMILDMSTNASLVTRTFIVLRLRNRMALHHSPVIVGRHINGITLNDLEWLLDENGAERIFSDQTEAFLLKTDLPRMILNG